jgi:arylsulfatase A-like enzyme
LTDFAIEAIRNEALGTDDTPDMLCISYSTPDIIGHSFGPYSKEIEDTYIRLDQEIARLIAELEKSVGKKNFVLFLTADHAVVPVPQFLSDKGLPGGYFFLEPAMNELRAFSVSKFGADLIEEQDNLNIYLNSALLEQLKLDRDEVAFAFAEKIRAWDEVKWAYTARELITTAHSDRWKEMVSKGYHKEESGDIIFILEAGYLPKTRLSETTHKGTSHGSAYSYDTHVPLLWYGSKIKGRSVVRPMEIIDIAASLTHLLKLQQPSNIEGTPIHELFGE